jgi:D-3-phosphoglycerate dehydrogenase
VTRTGHEVVGANVSVGPDKLDDAIAGADYLVLALPHTSETIGLLDARRLALMKDDAAIVNVGRGTAIVTPALVDALHAGRLGGAALDVTDPEPLPDDHALWKMPNVLVTVHTANTSALGRAAFAERVRENVERFRRGAPLVGEVDVDAGY